MTGVVVIGAGFGARVVAPSYQLADARVADVVSPRDEAAMLASCRRPDVDLVSVHAPPFLHRRCVEAASQAGKLVVCDKPFGRDVADAAAMAANPGVVNFEFRFHQGRIAVRDLVRSGRIGRVEHISWVHHTSGSRVPSRPHGWLFETALGGGWIGAWGSHVVDAVRWITGDDVVSVVGHRRQVIADRPDREGRVVRGDAEDGFTAALRLSSGVTVAIDSTFAASRTLPSRISVAGSEGVIEVVADTSITVRSIDGTKAEQSIPQAPGDPHLGPMQEMARHVVAVARGDESLADLPSFDDGLAARRVLDELSALPLVRLVSGPRSTSPGGDGR